MKAIGYDGILFSTINVSGGIEIGNSGASRRSVAINRLSSTPLPAGVAQDTRSFAVTFIADEDADIQETMFALMGALNLESPDEREFIAEKLDGTIVSCRASVGTYRWVSPNQVRFDFMATDPRWRAQTVTSVNGIRAYGTAPSGVTVAPLVNGGGVQVSPTLYVTPSAQRSSSSANVGWKYYRTVTITNNSAENWKDELITIDLGDTAAWVTNGKALASGNDVRVRYQGQEFYRTLTCFNTPRTLCHVLISLNRTKSKTLEIWYGNPSATAPDVTLSTRTGTKKSYAAPDLEGDSGTATGASTTSAITVAGKAWETNRWAGACVGILSGTGSVRWRRVVSNTGNVLTLNRALNTAPDATSTIVIWRTGILMDGGRVTTTGSRVIVDNLHTRKFGTNSLIGAKVTFHGGTASPSTMYVTANDDTSFTLDDGAGNAFSVNPTVGDSYTIQRYGLWQYVVDTGLQNTAHRGIARENRYFEPPGTIWPGKLTPAGWGPDTYLIDSKDDFSAYRPYNVGSGGGHAQNWWYLPRMRRRLGQAAALPFESEGDGFSIQTPQPLVGFYFDYQLQNELQVGKFVLAGREPGSEQWRDLVTDNTLYASLTPVAAQHVDLTAYNNPTRLGVFVLPYDGVAIPVTQEDDGTCTARTSGSVTDSSKSWIANQFKSGIIEFDSASTAVPKALGILSNTGTVITTNGSYTTLPTVGDAFTVSLDTRRTADIEFRPYRSWELYLSLTEHSALASAIYAVGSETEIYDMHATLRLGGGSDAVSPYDLVTIGGSGHWLALPLAYTLKIVMDPNDSTPLVIIQDGAGTFVSRAQWAVVIDRVVPGIDGGNVSLVPRQMFPLRPGLQRLVNPDFSTNIASWGNEDTSAGVTAAWSQDAAVYRTAPGSAKCVVSAAPAGSWHSYRDQTVANIPINTMVEAGFWVRTTNVSLKASISLNLVANGDNLVVSYVYTLPSTGAWRSIGCGGLMPIGDGLGSTGTAKVTIGIVATGAVTGTMYFDDGSLGPPNLYIAESAMGTLAIGAEWTEAWHS